MRTNEKKRVKVKENGKWTQNRVLKESDRKGNISKGK